ncbi:MAG: C45 family peptidase [Vulcanimicrobiota bacterium]
MKVLRLEKGLSATERGWVHGETFKDNVQELAEIRLELISVAWQGASGKKILALAEEHLPVLREYDADLYQEFQGIAQAAGLSEARLLVLNHYTDLRDMGNTKRALEEGCSILHARHGEEVLVAQTWDMHATAEPFCLMLFLPDEGVWVLTITGCLALCGLSSKGLAVTINNLVMGDARVGISWPTLVRKMLRAGSVAAAEQVLTESPVGSGHHYALVDPDSSRAWESSGSISALVYDGSRSPYVHTNHCLDAKMLELSRISPTSTTHHRYAQATDLLKENPRPNAEQLWEMMNCRINFPNSLFTDRTTEATPHGISTCARVLMDCRRREIWSRTGKDPEQVPLKFDWSTLG